ncbi:MAG: Na+/H+ antiporter subunit B [Bacteroidetes bacterium]|nr:Na+/H+ antiporter subunit B [Bacteroidota bacterium]
MRSVILSAATRLLLPLILLLSLFLLLRGHNEAGGGFVGGLVAAAGFVLHGIAHGIEASRRVLLVEPRILLGTGLLVAVVSGLLPLLSRKPFLTGLWIPGDVAVIGGLGTPMLFDVGVYLVVLGVVTMVVDTLAEE